MFNPEDYGDLFDKPFELSYAEERGTTMDILRNLAVGTGRAIKLAGDAFESESISGLGQRVIESPMLKPDESQYFGTQGRAGRVTDMITESLPTTVAIGATAAGGALIGGPVGGYLAGAGALGILGKGTYEGAYKEISEQRPDLDEDSKFKYGLVNAALEVGSEAIPFAGHLIGKAISVPAKKAALNALMDSKLVTPEALIGASLKTVDPKRLVGGIFGASALDGASEVVNEIGQRVNREQYGLESDPVDLIDVFLAGMVPSGAVTGGTVALDSRARSKVKSNVERGLTSEIPEVREDMFRQVSDGLAKVHPELQGIWDTNVGTLVKQGPVDLKTAIGDRQESEKSTLEKIVEDPQAIINEKLGKPKGMPMYEGVSPDEAEGLQEQLIQQAKAKSAEELTQRISEGSLVQQGITEEPEVAPGVEPRVLYEGMTDEDYLLVTESKLGVKPSDFKILQDTDAYAAESVKTSLQRISQYKQELSQTVVPEEREVLDKKIKGEARRVDNEFKNIGIDYKRAEAPVEKPQVAARTDRVSQLLKGEVTTEKPKSVSRELPKIGGTRPVVSQMETIEKSTAVLPKKSTEDTKAVPTATPVPKVENKVAPAAIDATETLKVVPTEIPKITPEQKEVTHVANGKYSDGSILRKNEKETKGATWLIEKGGTVYRAGSKEAAVEAIKSGTVGKLETYEEKTTRRSKLDKLLEEPMSDDQKASVESYIKNSPAVAKVSEVEQKINGLQKEMDQKLSQEERLQKEEAMEILRGEQTKILEGIQKEYDAAQVVIKQGLQITEENLKKAKKQLEKKEENKGSKVKPAGSVSAEDLFESEKGESSVTGDSIQYKTEGSNRDKLQQAYYQGDKRVTAETYKKLGSQKVSRVHETPDKAYRVVDKRDGPRVYVEVQRVSDGSVVSTAENLTEAEGIIKEDRRSLESPVEKPKTVIRRRSTEDQALVGSAEDYLGVDQDGDPEFVKLARTHVRDKKGNGQLALNTLRDMPNPTRMLLKAIDWLKAKVDEHHVKALALEQKYPTGRQLMESLMDAPGMTGRLANLLADEGVLKKLEDVRVELSWTGNYYRNGTVYLKGDAEPSSQLHEIVHSVTVQEMQQNPQFRERITEMMDKAKEQQKVFSPEDLKELKSLETSDAFVKSRFNRMPLDKRAIAYGLLNEKEFITQAFSSMYFQDFLKGIESTKKSLFMRFIDAVMSIFTKAKEVTLFEELIAVTKEISLYDTDGIMKDTDASFSIERATIDQTTAQIMRGSGPKETIKEELWKFLGNTKALAEKVARPISDIIYSISKEMHGALMKSETNKHLTHTEYQRGIKPFVKFMSSGLTPSQRVRLSVALLNYHTAEGRKVVKEMVPKDAWASVEDTLNKISQRSVDTGLLPEDALKENYFPRRVKDIAGLLEELHPEPTEAELQSAYESRAKILGRELTTEEREDVRSSLVTERGIIGEAFRTEAERLGVTELTPEQKTQVMSDMFQTGHFRGLRRPGAAKERSVPFVDAKTFKYYSDPVDALTAHILDMNENLGNRELLGLSTRKAQLKRLAARTKEIEQMDPGVARDEALALWDSENMRLMDMEGELQGGISSLTYKVMGDKSYNDQLRVIRMLESRIKQRGAHGVTEFLRNVGYMTTMGNFISAITQIPETAIVFADKGINKHTLGGIKDAFFGIARFAKNELLGRPNISTGTIVEDMDFTRSLIEFSSGSRSTRLLETIFKYSGLKYADLLGKEAFMQGSMRFWADPKNKGKFMKNFEPLLGKDLEQTYQDFLKKKRTPDTMAVLMSELAGYQPLTLSQQSQVYLEGGNLRLAYMLKTYSLRMLSRTIMEGTERFKRASVEYEKGNKAEATKLIGEGVRRMAGLAMLVALTGAGAEELKDLLRGRDSDFMENFYDKLLGLALLSRYTLDEGIQKEGIAKAIISSLVPPVKLIDTFGADMVALLSDEKEFKGKTFQLIPYVGTIGYAQSSAGQDAYAGRIRKEILEQVKENKKESKGAYYGDISEKIQEYNQRVKDPKKRITSDTISRAYKGVKLE